MEHAFDVHVCKSYHQDLKRTVAYYLQELEGPVPAIYFVAELEKTVTDLKFNWGKSPLVKDPFLREKQFRSIQVQDYVLMYKVDLKRKIIMLHRLLHTKPHWVEML